MKKSTIIALLVFAALLTVVFLSSKEKNEHGIQRVSFASLKTDQIDKIEISGKKAVTLLKKGEAWTLKNGKDADGKAVQRLIDALPKISSTHLVSSDSARFAEFEVDEEKGTGVKVYAGSAVVADFVLGKSAGGGSRLRVQGDVFNVNALSSYLFKKDKSAWYQLKLFNAKLDQVEKVEVKLHAAQPYTLVKKEES